MADELRRLLTFEGLALKFSLTGVQTKFYMGHRNQLSTHFMYKPVDNPNILLTFEGRYY